MPVKTSDFDFDGLFPFEHGLCQMESMLSDDIWNKFDIPHSDTYATDADAGSGVNNYWDCLDAENDFISSCLGLGDLSECDVKNHDCMWGGHCSSKEHDSYDFKMSNSKAVPSILAKPTAANVQPGRSLLLKANQNLQQTPAVSLPGLDSPPNSDDEDAKSKTETLQLLQKAISEFDPEDETELYDYFDDDDLIGVEEEEEEDEDEEVEEKPEVKQHQTALQQHHQLQLQQPLVYNTPTSIRAHVSVAVSDHCYHKDKNEIMRINNSLGVETPSDSEEEIDVVSVGEKTTCPTSRLVSSLPNNPSSRDRQHLQRTMASAIHKTNVRTIPRKAPVITPPSSSSSSEYSGTTTGRRRAIDGRGMKRSKHRNSVQPYKRRNYNHSSDSEPESLEKRSMHNNMERQRRIDLRNAFEELRALVPEVSKKQRAPKVVILREAAVYCGGLEGVSDGLERQVDELKRKQRMLRARVSQLRINLAGKHRDKQ